MFEITIILILGAVLIGVGLAGIKDYSNKIKNHTH